MTRHRQETLDEFYAAARDGRTASKVEPYGWWAAAHASNETLASEIAVRERGSYVTRLALTPVRGKGKTKLVPVLYCEDDLTVPKLTASHAMSPVGPAPDDIGGQHGPLRWVDYQKAAVSDTSTLALTASGWPPRVMRHFKLAPHELTTTTSVLNYFGESTGLSVGHHDYYAVAEDDATGMRIDGEPFDKQLGRKGALEAVMGGTAQFWPAFAGAAEISFPVPGGRRVVEIGAIATVGEGDSFKELAPDTLGMLFWHRRDTNSFCIEPVVGVSYTGDEVLRADGVTVAAGRYAMLQTTTRLVA